MALGRAYVAEPHLQAPFDKRGGAPRALSVDGEVDCARPSTVNWRLRRTARKRAACLPRKSWWSTTNERSTITTASPHRLATWIGLRSQIRSVATRSVAGSPSFPEGAALPYWQLYVADSMEPAPLSIDSVSLFFRYALSLTAWKRFHETTWSLRANPSSGNLHPTEGYALLPAVGAIHDRPGVYHYAPKEHGLERRADVDPSVWTALMTAFPEDHSSWGSRPFIGERPGSMASARSGTANMTWVMPLGLCASRLLPLAGNSSSSTV